MRNFKSFVFSLLVALTMSLALGAASSSAFQLTQHSFVSSFEGAGSTEGEFDGQLADIAIDQTSGAVYVATRQVGLVIDKFDSSGTAAPFSSPPLGGATSLNMGVLDVATVRVAVDNSGTATDGRIYVAHASTVFSQVRGTIWAFNRDGSPVGGNFPIEGDFRGPFAVDPTAGDLWIVRHGPPIEVEKFTSSGNATGQSFPVPGESSGPRDIERDSAGNTYVGETGEIRKFDSTGALVHSLSGAVAIGLNDLTNDLYAISTPFFGVPTNIVQYAPSGAAVGQLNPLSNGNSIAINSATKKIYVDGGGQRVDIFDPGATVTVPEPVTGEVTDFHATDVKIHGTVDPEGVDTTDCHVEWSVDQSFDQEMTCTGGNVVSGTGPQPVDAVVTGLVKGQQYHYRLVAANADGSVIGRQDRTFVPSSLPAITDQWADAVHADGVKFHATMNPEGAETSFRVEYGPADCATITCSKTPVAGLGTGLKSATKGEVVTGLQPDSEYHYRFVATNQSGTEYGADRVFKTFASAADRTDTCTNGHVRQQTSAVHLPDCRAYELVSAANTGGYNLESDLVAGQSPFQGYPDAVDRVLYGVHTGAIPGPWNPTNRGLDPYLATRGDRGWTTEYAGIPADAPSSAPFSSTVAEADSGLQRIAFGGPKICSPCFADGSAGMPVRNAAGALEQGMLGSIPQPTATPGGIVRKHFSAANRHFVFGSSGQFEPAGNSNGTDVTMYDRNTETGTTQVVSTLPDGSTIANGDGVAVLDISSDGSRIVVGELIDVDPDGNHYYHLYMHIGTDAHSVDLTPNAIDGALFDGMTSDGSRLFLTTADHLLSPEDSDNSADIYEAEVDGGGSMSLRLVSTESDGTPSNDDSCTPPGTPYGWNTVSGPGECSAVAIAGGGGVASGDGTFYFLSPEQLDSSNPQNQPLQDQANLYVSKPGQPPEFVATIDWSVGKPGPQPPARPANPDFLEVIPRPGTMTVDQSNGDLYVLIPANGELRRFDKTGAAKDFTAGPGAGGNSLSGFSFADFNISQSQVAVDNSGGPSDGNFYVTDTNSFAVRIFASSGEPLGSIEGAATPFGFIEAPAGVAVDQSNGNLYIMDANTRALWRYTPPASGPVTEADYSGGLSIDFEMFPYNIAAASGRVYIGSIFGGGAVRVYSDADLTPAPGFPEEASFTLLTTDMKALTVDPVKGDVYVDKGDRIEVFDATGHLTQVFGQGQLTASTGIAVSSAPGPSNGHVYASTEEKSIVEFGYKEIPHQPIDSPMVTHGVHESAVRRYGDFQITPDARFAAFATPVPKNGYDNGGQYEIYRRDSVGNLSCVSCNQTDARPEGDSRLASVGLSLLDDGTLFFNSGDALVGEDLNSRQDVYVSKEGAAPRLISTGTGPFDSSLLGASRDGTDAFFFTKDTLVPQDENGTLVKLYDARADGGFEFLPDPVQCKASDECHGAGTEAPPEPNFPTKQGELGNVQKLKKCKRGKVRKHGRCVPKRDRRKHRRHSPRHADKKVG
jgi:hypothetical protein